MFHPSRVANKLTAIFHSNEQKTHVRARLLVN